MSVFYAYATLFISLFLSFFILFIYLFIYLFFFYLFIFSYYVRTWRAGYYDMYVKLPDGLTCTQCVFQWKYHVGKHSHETFILKLKWYSLEPPRRGGSNVYPQSMF